jgi:hypothetical protein
LSEPAGTLGVMISDEPTALYRIWERDRKVLLYVGVSCSWPRRMSQHIADKPWFPRDGVVEFEEYPDRILALDAEAVAIRDESPLHNIQHNGDAIRLRLRVEAEVEMEYHPGSVFALLALISGGLLAGKLAADFLANWWVKRQGAKQGVPVQVPLVVNPFTQDPPGLLAQFFYLALAATANSEKDAELLKLTPLQGMAWMTMRPVAAVEEGGEESMGRPL